MKFDANWPAIVQWYAERLDEFSIPRAGKPAPIVYQLPDAPHYFYINSQAFVVEATRRFLLGTPQP